MTQEEKAKAYDEALRVLHKYDGAHIMFTQDLKEEMFPELKESEDKQSKKWILEYLYDGLRKSNEQFKGQFKTAIDWLEKQGEQKPAETNVDWSKEDDEMINAIRTFIACGHTGDIPTSKGKMIIWLKSLKHRA